jgi:peptide/nickel transport system substrate-binding protein
VARRGDQRKPIPSRFLRVTLAAAGLACITAPATAETPPNTLVMAYQIDDMISLDPA